MFEEQVNILNIWLKYEPKSKNANAEKKAAFSALAKIISGFAPFFTSTTILTPLRLDSSLISEISSTILSFVTSAIFSTNLDLLIVYGISVTTIDFFFSFFPCFIVIVINESETMKLFVS